MSELPPGYSVVPGTNKLRRVFDNAKDLREVYGLDPRTFEAARRYHPWYVDMPIRMTIIIGCDKRKGVFTYAQNETQAMAQAGLFWNKYFRTLQGLKGDDFPKVLQYDPKSPGTSTICTCLDDQDYDEAWSLCRKGPCYYAGNKEYPTTFAASNDVDIFSFL